MASGRNTPIGFGIAVIVAGVLAFFACMGAVAQAKPSAIGKGGVIYACYKTQNPDKGSVRVVGRKQHCRRGERKTSWSVTGPSGPAGTNGTNGTPGSNGTTTSTDTVKQLTDALNFQQLQIGSLLDQVEALQGVLGGLTNGDLLGALDQIEALQGVLGGLTNGELLDALANAAKLDGISLGTLNQLVGTLPVVSSLCSQLSTVTGQTNALRTVIGGISLNGVLTALGGLLNIPALPAALSPFSCPS